MKADDFGLHEPPVRKPEQALLSEAAASVVEEETPHRRLPVLAARGTLLSHGQTHPQPWRTDAPGGVAEPTRRYRSTRAMVKVYMPCSCCVSYISECRESETSNNVKTEAEPQDVRELGREVQGLQELCRRSWGGAISRNARASQNYNQKYLTYKSIRQTAQFTTT